MGARYQKRDPGQRHDATEPRDPTGHRVPEERRESTTGALRAAPEGDSLLSLLAALAPALAWRLRGSVPSVIANRGIALCGLVLLVSPVVLWTAWSAEALLVMLATVAIAFLLILALLWLGPGDRY